MPCDSSHSLASRICVPLPEPSTPSNATNSPFVGGRFSLGTRPSGCGLLTRNRRNRLRVTPPAKTAPRPAIMSAARVPDRSIVRSPSVSSCAPIAPAITGNSVSDRNSPSRESTVKAPNVLPRNSSVTFSWSRTYPLTHADPQNVPRMTVTTAANMIPGIAARTNRDAAAAMIE